MKKVRQSNLECMRIFLMLSVVVYHLVLYNGVLATEFNPKTLIGLLATSGGAIVADYAFICLSAYFLLETKKAPIFTRFFTMAFQILVIYILRFLVIRGLFGFHTDNMFLEDMIMKGAWWFGYCYLILLLIYPMLNKMISVSSARMLGVTCLVLGIWVTVNWLTNQVNLFHDMVMLLFTYFCMGFLKKRRECGKKCLVQRKMSLVIIYMFFYLFVLGICIYLKKAPFLDYEQSGLLVTRMIGKYFLVQAVMGFCVFFFFKQIAMKQHLWINRLSKATFFVFLLHETVMGIFWRFGMVDGNTMMYSSTKVFIIQGMIYIISSFVAGFLVQTLYEKYLQPIINKLIAVICDTKVIRILETIYQKIW